MKSHNELFGQPNTLYLYVFINLTHTHTHTHIYIYIYYIQKHNQKNEGSRMMSFMKISAFRKMTGEKVMTISSISSVGKLGSYI